MQRKARSGRAKGRESEKSRATKNLTELFGRCLTFYPSFHIPYKPYSDLSEMHLGLSTRTHLVK